MIDIYVFVFPLLLLLILVEFWKTKRQGLTAATIPDTITNLNHGILFRVFGLFTVFPAYDFIYNNFKVFQFSNGVVQFLIGILIFEFCHYWWHRLSHSVNLMWASHEAHHSSNFLNFSTALRVPFTGVFFQWPFYLPMAFLGISPVVFKIISFLSFFYGTWTHTQTFRRSRIWDKFIVTPSVHRVHHGSNQYCLNKNFSEILTIWDHVFGTYQAERENEKIHFGLPKPVISFNPIWSNLHYYRDIWRISLGSQSLRKKVSVWFAPPSDFELESHLEKSFKVSAQVRWYSLIQFAAMTSFVGHFLLIFKDLNTILAFCYALGIATYTLIQGAILEGKSWGRKMELTRLTILPFLFYLDPFGYFDPNVGFIILTAFCICSVVWLENIDKAAGVSVNS